MLTPPTPPLPLYPLLSSAPSLCLFYSLWLWSLLQFAFDPRIAGCNCCLCCFCFLAGFGLAFFELLSLHAVVPLIDVGFINFFAIIIRVEFWWRRGRGAGRSCLNTSFAIAVPASEAGTVAQRGV